MFQWYNKPMESKEKLIQISSLIILCLLAFLVTYFGLRAGIESAQSKVLIQNTNTLITALDYFKADSDRYPSALEFTNDNLMRAYLSPLPIKEFLGGNCPASFLYDSTTSLQYHLAVCLPRGSSNLTAGWNQVR